MKKQWFLVLVLGLFFAFGSTGAAFAKTADKVCATNCTKCAKVCESAANKLEKKKGDAALVKQIRECANTCRAHAKKVSEGTAGCVTACAACAEACQKSGDASLKECAKQCDTCASCCKDR